jgi:uncharacterized protein (TIGR00369 family)
MDELTDNENCFVCGKKNNYGLQIKFIYSNGTITADFTPSDVYQGYRNITHGGIISTILDEAMIQAAIAEGIFPVTAEINVRFKKPLTIGQKTTVFAEITKKGTKLIYAFSKITDNKNGNLIATASAKLIPS